MWYVTCYHGDLWQRRIDLVELLEPKSKIPVKDNKGRQVELNECFTRLRDYSELFEKNTAP